MKEKIYEFDAIIKKDVFMFMHGLMMYHMMAV